MIGAIVAKGLDIIDKFIPDPEEKAKAIFRLKELEQKGDIEALNAEVALLLGQIEVNKVEAASTNLFKSGWRPFVGWVCGSAFAYKFILQPFLVLWIVLYNPSFDVNLLPELNAPELMAVLMGMLGLGTMRSFDRLKGKAPKGE